MGGRNYLSGTREALTQLSQGFCYFPGCSRTVIEFVEGHPMFSVDVAHIHAAEPGGPYYMPDMTEAERRHFDNLILLCKPHHTLVDKREPEKFPPELRRQWKEERESLLKGEYQAALRVITTSDIEEAIEEALKAVRPSAAIAVELTGGAETIDGGFISIPLEGLQKTLDDNSDVLAHDTGALLATARNTGDLPVDIESWNLIFDPAGVGLVGANHYLTQATPQRVDVGSSVHWRWSLPNLAVALRELVHRGGVVLFDLHAEARLAIGTTIRSESVGLEQLPLWERDISQEMAKARADFAARRA